MNYDSIHFVQIIQLYYILHLELQSLSDMHGSFSFDEEKYMHLIHKQGKSFDEGKLGRKSLSSVSDIEDTIPDWQKEKHAMEKALDKARYLTS